MKRTGTILMLILSVTLASSACSSREKRMEELTKSDYETEIFDASDYKNALKGESEEQATSDDNKQIEYTNELTKTSNNTQTSNTSEETLTNEAKETLKQQIITELVKNDSFKGTQGAAGLNGTDGKDGVDGKNGTNGTTGKDGTNGKDGINGKDGKSIIGATGKTGETGTAGTDGKDGYTPVSGVDYYTDTEIEAMKKELVTQVKSEATPKKGIDYYTDDDVSSIVDKVSSTFANNNVISSSATECGTWLDGSKIYSQTFIIPIKKDEATTVSHEIENISTIWIDSQNSFIALSDLSKSYILGGNEFGISVSASKSSLDVSEATSDKELVSYVTLRFVKTK